MQGQAKVIWGQMWVCGASLRGHRAQSRNAGPDPESQTWTEAAQCLIWVHRPDLDVQGWTEVMLAQIQAFRAGLRDVWSFGAAHSCFYCFVGLALLFRVNTQLTIKFSVHHPSKIVAFEDKHMLLIQ